MKHYQKYRVANKGIIIYSIYLVIIVLSFFWEAAIAITLLIIGILSGIMYVVKGFFDKISFSESGFTTYRLFSVKFYKWSMIDSIKYKKQLTMRGNELAISIKLEGAKEILLLDDGRILSELKNFYDSELTT